MSSNPEYAALEQAMLLSDDYAWYAAHDECDEYRPDAEEFQGELAF